MPKTSRPAPLIIGLGVVIVLLAGAIGIGKIATPEPQKVEEHVLVTQQPYSVGLSLKDTTPSPGKPTQLNFTVLKNGVVHDIYKDEVVVHYVIASENYQDFYHTFSPEVEGPGRFSLTYTFTQPGRYRIWTEVVDTTTGKELQHGETAALVSYRDLHVTGQSTITTDQVIHERRVAVGDYTVVLDHPVLSAGQPTSFRLHVEDAQGATVPVFTEEPAIYVLVGPNFTFFRHTHAAPATPTHEISLTETFPVSGDYLFFTEIYAQTTDGYIGLQIPFGLEVQ